MLALAAALAGLAVLLVRLDLSGVARAFARARWWWVAGAAAMNVGNTVLESARWTFILSGIKPGVKLRHAVAAGLVGTVGNVALPLKLGEGARAWTLARLERLPFTVIISSVIVDRFIEVTLFLVLVLATAWIRPPAGGAGQYAVRGALVAAIVAVVLVLAGRWLRRGDADGGTGAGRFRRIARELARGFAVLQDRRRLVPAAATGVLSWVARTLVVWMMFRAFDLPLGLPAAAAALIIINVGIVSVSTPGNLGVFELTTTAALTLLGVRAETALSVAVVLHVAEVVPPLLLGLAVMWKLGLSGPSDRAGGALSSSSTG